MKKLLFVGILLISLCSFSIWSQTSAKEMEKIAKKATPREQYDIAHKFYNGDGVTKNEKLATKWILNAAKNGDAELQYTIAHDLFEGNNITKNPNQAEKLLEKAAKAGDASIKMKVGDDYLNGNGVTVDYKKAEKYFKEAAKTNPQGFLKLGDMYSDTVNGKLHLGKAIKYYEKAAKGGYVLAYVTAGDLCVRQNQIVREKLENNKVVFVWEDVRIGENLIHVEDYYLYLPKAMKFYGKAFDEGCPEGVAAAIKLLSKEKKFSDLYSQSDKVRGDVVCWTKRLETFTDPAVAMNLGDTYVSLGNLKKAIENYNIALTYHTAQPSVIYEKLAKIYEEIMDFEKTLECYQKGEEERNQYCANKIDSIRKEMPKGINNLQEYLLVKNTQNHDNSTCNHWLSQNFKNFDRELKYYVAYEYLTDISKCKDWGWKPEDALDSFLLGYKADKINLDTVKAVNYNVCLPFVYRAISGENCTVFHYNMEIDEKLAAWRKCKEFLNKTKDVEPGRYLIENINNRFGECNATKQIPLSINKYGYENTMNRINNGVAYLTAEKEKENKRIQDINKSFRKSDIYEWLQGTWLGSNRAEVLNFGYGVCYAHDRRLHPYWVEGNTIYVQISETDFLGRCEVYKYTINKSKKRIDGRYKKISTEFLYDIPLYKY